MDKETEMNKKFLLILSITICFLISCLAMNILPSTQDSKDISNSPQKPIPATQIPQSPFSIQFMYLKATNENGWTNYEGHYSIVFNNSPFLGEAFPVTCFPKIIAENDNEPIEYFYESHVTTEEGYSYSAYLDRFVIPYTWPEMNVLLAPGFPVYGEWLAPETGEWSGRSHPILTDNPERAWANGLDTPLPLYNWTITFKVPDSLHPKTLVIPCLNSEITIPDPEFIETRMLLPEGVVDLPESYERGDLNLSLQVDNFNYSNYPNSTISLVLVPIEIKNNELTASFINIDETIFVTLIDPLRLIWKPVNCSSIGEGRNPDEIGPGQEELFQYCFVSKYEEHFNIPEYLFAIIGDESDTMIFMDRDLSD